MKTKALEQTLTQLILKCPKNPEKLAKELVPILMEIAKNSARTYYSLAKQGVFRSDNINVKALMDMCEAKKEEYKQDPMSLVYDIEDEMVRQIDAFYGE